MQQEKGSGKSPRMPPKIDGTRSIEDIRNLLLSLQSAEISSQKRVQTCNGIVECLRSTASVPSSIEPDQEDFELLKKTAAAICTTVYTYYGSGDRQLLRTLKDLYSRCLAECCRIFPRSHGEVLQLFSRHPLMRLHAATGSAVPKAVFVLIEILLREEMGRPRFTPTEMALLYKTLPRESCEATTAEPFFTDILAQLKFKSAAPAAGKAFTALVKELYRESATSLEQESSTLNILHTWSLPLREFATGPHELQLAELYILPGLLKAVGFSVYKNLLEIWDFQKNSEIVRLDRCSNSELLLLCLRIGKESGYVVEQRGQASEALMFNSEIINGLFVGVSPRTMIKSLSVLAASNSTTTQIPLPALTALRSIIPDLHEICDGDLRNQLLKSMKDLFKRMLSSSYAAARAATNIAFREKGESEDRGAETAHPFQEMNDYIEAIHSFMDWYVTFLLQLLRPGSPHASCVSAIELLFLLLCSGLDIAVFDPAGGTGTARRIVPDIFNGNVIRWPFRVPLLSQKISQLLIDNLFNPFEDVRKKIFSYSRIANPLQVLSSEELSDIVRHRFVRMSESGRESDIDGFARLAVLLSGSTSRRYHKTTEIRNAFLPKDNSVYEVSSWITELLGRSIQYSVKGGKDKLLGKHSIIGSLSALAMTIAEFNGSSESTPATEWEELIMKAFELSVEGWWFVQESLRDSSPEGYIPDQTETSFAKSQELQSFCWRTAKEAACLMSVLASISSKLNFAGVSLHVIERAARLIFEGLVNIRHRGAFTAIAPIFSSVCGLCLGSSDPKLSQLPELFMEEALAQLDEKSRIITRRSAGLPMIFISILSAELRATARVPSFQRTFRLLSAAAAKEVVNDGTQLPQVHAINCLRSIFMDSKLESSSVKYIVPGLELALNCFTSELWAVRNCGIMLFNTLVNRVFGVQQSQNKVDASGVSSHMFFLKYPTLHSVLLRLASEYLRDEIILPILSLFSRLGFSEEGNAFMEPFQELAISYMSHSNQKIRESAARAFVASLDPRMILDVLRELLLGIKNGTCQNVIYSKIYAALLIVRRWLKKAPELSSERYLQELPSLVAEAIKRPWSKVTPPNTTALQLRLMCEVAYLEIDRNVLYSLFSENQERDCVTEIDSLRECIREHSLAYSSRKETSPQSFLLLSETARAITLLDSNQNHGDHSLLSATLLHATSGGDIHVLRCILRKMVELNFKVSSSSGSLRQTLYKILIECSDVRVKAEVATLLSYDQEADTSTLSKWDYIYETFQKSENECLKSPLLILLASSVGKHGNKDDIGEKVDNVLKLIYESYNEYEPRDLRLAALEALSRIWMHIDLQPTTSHLRARFHLLLMDIAIDDDEEIRSKAVQLYQTTAAEPVTLTPRATTRRIATMLVREFRKSDAAWLSQFLIERLCELNMNSSLERAEKSAKMLFASEKQNTFVDNLSKFEIYISMLKELSDLNQPVERSKLNKFVRDGLREIITALERPGDKRYITSDPDVFETTSCLIECGYFCLSHLDESALEDYQNIRTTLEKLRTGEMKRYLHPLWVDKLEKL